MTKSSKRKSSIRRHVAGEMEKGQLARLEPELFLHLVKVIPVDVQVAKN